VSKGTEVLSPARSDLADGARVRVDNSRVKPEPVVPDAVPETVAERSFPPASPALNDPDSAVISAAISAHIDSVVSDARRNYAKYGANR
jgi:hypothetical protein